PLSNTFIPYTTLFRSQKNFENVHLLPIGRKANDFFKRRPYPIRKQATHVYQALSLKTAIDIAQTFIHDFIAGDVDAVYVVFNEFKSLIAQQVRVVRLLPLERAWDELQNEVDYLYEPTPAAIL